MKRRTFLGALGVGALGAVAWRMLGGGGFRVARGNQPNLVLIVLDDLGYADLGCQGAKDLATPNIDALAAGGVRFTDAYVSSPICSPCRAGLMTGKYQERFGYDHNPDVAGKTPETFGLPLTEKTLADQLKAAGYVTGMVGKWHLGLAPQYHPMKRGFDEYFGFLHGSHSYWKPKAEAKNPILRGSKHVDEQEYLTDAFSREAVKFIERHEDRPFFLYLAYSAPHVPMEAPPQKYMDRFANIADPARKKFAAMMAAADDGVGAMVRKLRELKLEENTLILVMSDNGGHTEGNTSKNTPFSGEKGDLREGGIRIPWIMRWPGHLPAGKIITQPVMSIDVFPTFLAAGGAAIPTGLDGVNILPLCEGKTDQPPHQELFWRYDKDFAMRRGQWKLLVGEDGKRQLFDLAGDPGEAADLSAKQPQIMAEMSTALAAWSRQMPEPLWGPPPLVVSEKAKKKQSRPE